GRVLLGSGNFPGGSATEVEWADFRYYYPDYMFKNRPQIAFANDTINVSEYFMILVPHDTSIGEAALVGLGSMTHSFDMSQRHVQLRVMDPRYIIGWIDGQWVQATPDQCAGGRNLCYDMELIQGPASKELAPPGYYILFVLDKDRVPSQGKIIRL